MAGSLYLVGAVLSLRSAAKVVEGLGQVPVRDAEVALAQAAAPRRPRTWWDSPSTWRAAATAAPPGSRSTREGQAVLLREGGDIGRPLVDGDGHDHEAVPGERAVEAVERRQLVDAGGAPGGPEIQDDDVAPEGSEGDLVTRSPRGREAEARLRLARQKGVSRPQCT